MTGWEFFSRLFTLQFLSYATSIKKKVLIIISADLVKTGILQMYLYNYKKQVSIADSLKYINVGSSQRDLMFKFVK